MSLDRKDIRAKLSHEHHAQLRAICEVDGVDIGDWVECILVPVIERRVREAIELAAKLPTPGKPGRAQE
jgi:hypothetical protein